MQCQQPRPRLPALPQWPRKQNLVCSKLLSCSLLTDPLPSGNQFASPVSVSCAKGNPPSSLYTVHLPLSSLIPGLLLLCSLSEH